MDVQLIVRKQLTLFVPEDTAPAIEKVRKLYNPIQHQLIRSHVTLCREDEIEDIDRVIENLDHLTSTKCTITFGKPIRFDQGKGLMLPAQGDITPIQTLRASVLKDTIAVPKNSMPHITLIHPRNGTCTDEIFDTIQTIEFPSIICFDNIQLIEQHNGGKWQSLHRWSM